MGKGETGVKYDWKNGIYILKWWAVSSFLNAVRSVCLFLSRKLECFLEQKFWVVHNNNLLYYLIFPSHYSLRSLMVDPRRLSCPLCLSPFLAVFPEPNKQGSSKLSLSETAIHTFRTRQPIRIISVQLSPFPLHRQPRDRPYQTHPPPGLALGDPSLARRGISQWPECDARNP